MDDLERRLLTLEMEFRHERELSDFRYETHSRQLQAIEAKSIDLTSAIKFGVAMLLPIGAWLLTGDLRKVLAVVHRMTAGG